MPSLSTGLLVAYGDDRLMADQMQWRGYTGRCGLAAMTPSALGRVAWVRTTGPWIRCVVADVVAQHHAYRAVYVLGEIAEVPDSVRLRLGGWENGAPGQVWLGTCQPPTDDWTPAREYHPRLAWSEAGERRPAFWPIAAQEQPVACPPAQWE